MSKLTDEQKQELIEKAQNLYRKGFSARVSRDPFAREIQISNFKEACHDMSQLIHYLAKEMYKVPDEDNLIYHCEFCYNGNTRSHMFNKIYNRIVDSTIMQFDNFSPYDNHDECYTNLELISHCYGNIELEIDLYGTEWYMEYIFNKNNEKTSKKFSFRKLFNK